MTLFRNEALDQIKGEWSKKNYSVAFSKVLELAEKGDEGTEFNVLEDEQSSDNSALASQVQDAHNNLMHLSYENRLSFQEVMEALEQQEQAV